MDSFMTLQITNAIDLLRKAIVETVKTESELTRSTINNCLGRNNNVPTGSEHFMENLNERMLKGMETAIVKLTDSLKNLSNIESKSKARKETIVRNISGKSVKHLNAAVYKYGINKKN